MGTIKNYFLFTFSFSTFPFFIFFKVGFLLGKKEKSHHTFTPLNPRLLNFPEKERKFE